MECFPLPPIPIVLMHGNVFSMSPIKMLNKITMQATTVVSQIRNTVDRTTALAAMYHIINLMQ